MMLIIRLFPIALLMGSCQKDIPSESSNLVGKWDMRLTGSGDILWNYEQGFELVDDGTYTPRYWNNDNSTWESVPQESISQSWELRDTEDNKFLYFYYEYLLFDEVRKDTVCYEIVLQQDKSMKLVGINPDGKEINFNVFRGE